MYALQVERILAERTLVAVLIAGGHAPDLEMPSVQDFDESIGMTEPDGLDLSPEERELRQELGLRVR